MSQRQTRAQRVPRAAQPPAALPPPPPAEAPAPRARQTRTAQRAPRAATRTNITDTNIYDLVSKYLRNRNRLPADLRDILIGDWDVSSVTNMRYLFYGATNFNEPLNNWNVSNVRDMTSMFNGATSFSHNPNWNIGPNVITTNMFSGTEIERAQAPAAARPPPPPQEPGGVAYEIHNAFDRFKLNEFIDLIKSKSNFMNRDRPNFMNRDRPLQPLIDNINANPANSEEVKRDLTAKINRIFTTLREYGGYNANIDKITFCIQYVLMQPQEFIDAYIQTFISDCLKAYSSGRQESCIKGMYERIFYSFRDTIATICLDQMQGTGASPLCKPEYITLFEYFYETETWPKEGPGGLNEYTQEWYGDVERVSALSPENRIEDFVNFVRSKINNAARFKQAEASIRKYANEDLQNMSLFGGKRRSKRSVKKRSVKKRSVKIRSNTKSIKFIIL